MGIRLIIYAILAFVIYQLGKSWLRRVRQNGAPKRINDVEPRIPKVVRCVKCGVHVPVKQAILNDSGDYYCRDHDRSAS